MTGRPTDRAPARPALDRVAYVCTDPGIPVLGSKGASIHVRAVLAELTRRAREVHLFATRLDGDPAERLPGVVVHALPRPRGEAAEREAAAVLADDVLAQALAETGGGRGFDLVYQRYALWSCAGLELAAERGWPSVLEINAPLVDEQALHRTLVDRAGASARTVRAVRAASAAYAVTGRVASWAGQLAGRPVATIANGVDPTRFAPRDVGGDAPGTLTIGFVGTFKPWHGLTGLVRAVAAVHRDPALPPVRLLLVGDGPELPSVLARAERAGLGDVVEHTGAVDADDVPALLAGVDVAMAPYPTGEHYFSPLKVFEYLAAGVPVVASAVAELPALLVDGEEALLVPPGDDVALTRALHRLCADPALRARVGAAGRIAAETRLGWSGVVDRALALTGSTEGRAA